MGPEESRERLARDLVHSPALRQRLLDAMDAGRDSACTDTHTITFDHQRRRATISYELVAGGAPTELSFPDFAQFVRTSTTCSDKKCRLCALQSR